MTQTKLTDLEKQQREDARSAFLAAVYAGADAKQLLTLAEPAGMTAVDAERLARRIRDGLADIEHVGRLPDLRTTADAAQARLEARRPELKAEIAKLDDELCTLGNAAGGALRAQREAEGAARRVLRLHDEGLLPSVYAPAELSQMLKARVAHEKAMAADKARVDTANRVRGLRTIVRSLERALATVPLSARSRLDASAIEKKLTSAQAALTEAETDLVTAEATAKKLRRSAG